MDQTKIADLIKDSSKQFSRNDYLLIKTVDALLNIRYLDDDQWVTYDLDNREFVKIDFPENISKSVANYMLPFHESVKARILAFNPRPVAVPRTRDWDDQIKAKGLTTFFGGIFNNIDFEDILQDVVDTMDVARGAYMYPYWDKSLGKDGDINVEVMSDVLAYIDPVAKRMKNARYMIFFDLMDLDYINLKAPKELKEDNISKVMDGWFGKVYSELLNASISDTNSKVDINNAKVVARIFYLDKKKKPMVEYYTDIDTKPVKLDIKQTAYTMPIYTTYYKNAFSKFGRSPLSRLRNAQRDINWTLTRIKAEYNKTNKILYDENTVEFSADADTFDWGSDEMVAFMATRPGEKPMMFPSPIGKTIDLSILQKVWSDIGGLSEASRGQVPTSQSSALLVSALVDQDETKLGSPKTNLKVSLRKVFKVMRDIIKDMYKEDRIVNFFGRENGWEAQAFEIFKDKLDNFDIEIEIGSSLPTTPAMRISVVQQLFQMGLFNDMPNPMKHARELMSLNVFELDKINADYSKQQYEIELIISITKGTSTENPPGADVFDDHITHVKTIIDFMKTNDFDRLEEKGKTLIYAHLGQHQRVIMQAMKTAPATGNVPNPQQAQPQAQPQAV